MIGPNIWICDCLEGGGNANNVECVSEESAALGSLSQKARIVSTPHLHHLLDTGLEDRKLQDKHGYP